MTESDKTAARKSDTSSAYATVDELRNYIGMARTTDDVELARLLDSAERWINRFTNHPDGFVAPPNATTRYYAARGGPFLLIDECVSITTVSVKDSATDTSYTSWTSPSSNFANDGDWFPFAGDPEFPQFNRLPFTGVMVDPSGDEAAFTSGRFTGRRGFRPSSSVERGIPTARIEARWGYSASIPDDIKIANLSISTRMYKRLSGGMADALANVDIGGRMVFVRDVDPDVRRLLRGGRYFKPTAGA